MAMGDKGATLDGLKASHDNLDGKITNLKSDLTQVSDDVYEATDNLVDTTIQFSKWKQGWPTHTNYTYGVYYDEYIAVDGGEKFYGNFGAISAETVGSNFRFRIFQYDENKDAITVDWSSLSVTPNKTTGAPASVTLNASTRYIIVVLSTDSNSYPITPNTIKDLPVYFGPKQVQRADIYPTVQPVTTALDTKFTNEVDRLEQEDGFINKSIESDNSVIDAFIGTRTIKNLTVPTSNSVIPIASFPLKAGNYIISITIAEAVSTTVYFGFLDASGENVFNTIGITAGNTNASFYRKVSEDVVAYLSAGLSVEVTISELTVETFDKGINSYAKVSSLVDIADRVGYIGVTNISVPKGTTKGLLFNLNLKQRKEYVFHAKFVSALTDAVYFHINTSTGTVIQAIGMASGLTERTITYVPDADYTNANVTITASNSTQTLEKVEISFDGSILENAVSDVDLNGQNMMEIYTDSKHLLVYNPYKTAGSNQYKGQMHCHTIGGANYDEQLCTAQECINAHAEAGYDFITITDYARTGVVTGKPSDMKGMVWLCDALEEVIGANVSDGTPTTHAITYFVEERTLPEMDNVQLAMTTFKNEGKIPSLAHPMWTGTPWTYAEAETLRKDITFVEVWNGLCHYHEELGDDWITNAYEDYTDFAFDALLSSGVHAFCTAVNDLHAIVSAIVDDGYVVVMADEKTRGAIWDALLSGSFYASNGATFENITLNGNVLVVTTAESCTIEFVGKDGDVLSTTNGVTSASYEIDGTEGYVRCRITDGNGKKAWSQAVVIK